MRVRVRFSKFGSARFIGHLDVMRYFQKAFRRAGLPLSYSEGYHPHPILSFAQPLSLSFTSDGEYFDMELNEELSEDEIQSALCNSMCEDICVNKVTILPDFRLNEKKSTGMSLITGAYYAISLKDMPVMLLDSLKEFIGLQEFIIEKSTKKGTKEINLGAGIHDIFYFKEDSFETIVQTNEFAYSFDELKASMANAMLYDNSAIVVSLDAGSENNISADLFLEGIFKYSGIDPANIKRTVHRIDLFGDKNGRKVPLWMIES